VHQPQALVEVLAEEAAAVGEVEVGAVVATVVATEEPVRTRNGSPAPNSDDW